MKRKIFILTIIISLLSSFINIYGDESFNTVVVNFIDQNEETIKEKEVLSFVQGTSVSLDLNDYEIEGYEIDKTILNEFIRQEDNLLIIDSINEDLELSICYIALKSYTVNKYIETDTEIILDSSISKIDRVYKEVPTIEDKQAPKGYKLIRNDISTIEKDGSTVINLYYIKDYYLVTFDLNGGYDGPESIYGEFGLKIENLKAPKKDGYDFIGWFLDSECTVPVEISNLYIEGNITYYAGYNLKQEEALVSIMYYGENPNDNHYSFLGKEDLYLPIGQEYSIDEEIENSYIHKHHLSCFGASDEEPLSLSEHQINGFKSLSPTLEDDYVYLYKNNGIVNGENYYIKKNGQFYKTDKYHVSYQIGDVVHLKEGTLSATDDFRLFKPAFTCGAEFEFDHSDKIIVKENDNIVNVYLKRSVYTLSFGNNDTYPNDYYGHIEAKWDSFIYEEFEAITDLDRDNIGWGVVNQRNGDTLKLLICMPKENNNYYLKTKIDGTKHINYYLKIDDTYTKIYSTNWSAFASTVTESDFIEINGYEVNEELSIKVGDHLALGNGNNIYYDPRLYDLLLVSYPDTSESFKIRYNDTMTPASLYQPMAKTEYEIFAGWYLNSNYEGEPIDLTSKKMPAYNLSLYAKWDKRKMNVRFIDAKTSLDQTLEIGYGEILTNPPVIDDVNFIGWVKDNSSSLVVNLKNYKVLENINLYALYDEDIFVNYTIKYQSEDGLDLAPSKHGSIIKGNSIYVVAKSKDELSTAYKGEYKPIEVEHEFVANELSNTFIITYIPVIKYSLIFNPINLKNNDSIIAYINGHGFNDLELAINKQTTVLGLYEDEEYVISFDNSYSYTYENIEPVTLIMTEDKTINLNLNKKTYNFYDAENHQLNIFN